MYPLDSDLNMLISKTKCCINRMVYDLYLKETRYDASKHL